MNFILNSFYNNQEPTPDIMTSTDDDTSYNNQLLKVKIKS